jgi:predicted TIM-barrel fold metal-dependent hydrolase
MAAVEGHGQPPDPDEVAGQRIAAMDVAEIDWAVIQPTQMYLRPEGARDTMRINDELAAVWRVAPERFRIAVGTADPLAGAAGVDEAERCLGKLGLHGLSWHHRFQGCFIDAPLMSPLLERLADTGGVAVIHTNSTSQLEAAWRLVKLARQFPGLTFLALDAFFSFEGVEHALELVEERPNVLWDLGGPFAEWLPTWQLIERWILQHGADRLTFSADITYGHVGKARPSRLLENIVESPLSEAAQAAILGGNVRRAFAHFL